MSDLPVTTRPGPISLTVSDLDRSVGFWTAAIGLDLLERSNGTASLGAGGTELLELVELPGSRPAPRASGLYHVALLVPERAALARWLLHVAQNRIALQGLSDHFVSEAIYLADPDGHGIEVYSDRPREHWEGWVEQMGTFPLDVDNLLGSVDPDLRDAPFTRLPADTTVGHIHLKVQSVPASIAYYRDVIGFDLMVDLDGTAGFLSVGGYHHHVGVNIWHSLGSRTAPQDSASLRHASLRFEDTAARDAAADRVREAGYTAEEIPAGIVTQDPSGITLRLVSP
jgi:catechol 2,3-dioxygenase